MIYNDVLYGLFAVMTCLMMLAYPVCLYRWANYYRMKWTYIIVGLLSLVWIGLMFWVVRH